MQESPETTTQPVDEVIDGLENPSDFPTREEIVDGIMARHQEPINIGTLIKSIVLSFGEINDENNYYINERKLDYILITLLTEDGLNMAYFIESMKNNMEANPNQTQIIFEYNPLNGNSYIKIPDNA